MSNQKRRSWTRMEHNRLVRESLNMAPITATEILYCASRGNWRGFRVDTQWLLLYGDGSALTEAMLKGLKVLVV